MKQTTTLLLGVLAGASLGLTGCSAPQLKAAIQDAADAARSGVNNGVNQTGRVVPRLPSDPRTAGPSATAQLPQAANRNGAGGQAAPEAFQAKRYDGPPRWGFDAEFASRIARLQVFSTGGSNGREQRVSGDARSALGLYLLSRTGSSAITFREVMAQLEVPAPLLDCEYSRTERTADEAANKDFKPETIKMFFWQAGTRKTLTAQMLRPYQSKSDQIADVERDTCPADFPSALSAGFGEGAWLAPAQLAVNARAKEVQKNYDLGLWNPVDYSQWAQGAKRLPAAEERALAREMDQVLKDKKPMTEAYYIALNRQLQPAMAKLAASGLAQARAIPKGEAGRKAFEQWDSGVGYTVVSLALRVHSSGQPTNLFVHVLGEYQTLYAEQIADKGALDKQYLAQMIASIAKYKAAGDATPEPTPEYQRSNSVLVMRPRQSALYRMVDSGVRVVQEYARARAEIERQLNEMDKNIKETRQAFWACYAKRCPEGGQLFYKFSVLMADSDRFLIGRTAQQGLVSRSFGGAQHGDVFLQLMGLNREVNTQYVGACDHLYDRFLGQFTNWMGLDAARMRKQLDEALAGDDYLKVQQCRDRMEFIMRPSPEMRGLY